MHDTINRPFFAHGVANYLAIFTRFVMEIGLKLPFGA
jgi:hypothetical protein